MKTLPVALFFLLLFHRLPAQEQRFVEVVVSDTIVLPATHFVYSVMLYPWDTGDDYGAGTGDPILTAEKLQQMARQFGASTAGPITGDVTITLEAEQEPQVFPLYFDSPTRLPALAEQLRRYVNVSAHVSEINNAPETSFDERLSAKVLAKASLKAQHLAWQLGARLGPALQVLEVIDLKVDHAIGEVR